MLHWCSCYFAKKSVSPESKGFPLGYFGSKWLDVDCSEAECLYGIVGICVEAQWAGFKCIRKRPNTMLLLKCFIAARTVFLLFFPSVHYDKSAHEERICSKQSYHLISYLYGAPIPDRINTSICCKKSKHTLTQTILLFFFLVVTETIRHSGHYPTWKLQIIHPEVWGVVVSVLLL